MNEKLEIGHNIYNSMVSQGMKQADLVKKSGVSQPLLSFYMSGRSEPTLTRAAKIAKALNINIEDMLPSK